MASGYSLYSFCRYTTFGSPMSARSFNASSSRYGFNGKEKDDEIKGNSNSINFDSRILDVRLGKWLSCDPLQYVSVSWTPYNFVKNCPMILIDPDGEKEKPYVSGVSKPILEQKGTATPMYIYDKSGVPVKYHPNAKNAYNCHSYAWHKSLGDQNDLTGKNNANTPKWDNDPSDDISQQNGQQLNANYNNKVGDIVIYYQDVDKNGKWSSGEPIAHSALVKEVDKEGNTLAVEGKMGQAGISINHPSAPGYYETDNLKSTGNKLSHAYLRTNANFKTVGKLKFFVVQDANSGKSYAVTKDAKGSYQFYTGAAKNPSNKQVKKP
jgi:RHS repeat-associated protein